MAHTGKLVDTYDFSKQLPKMMIDRKYEDLFYFFTNLDDFDFSKELLEYQDKCFISVISQEEGTTIQLLHKFCYPVSSELLNDFDKTSIHLMKYLQTEVDLSTKIEKNLPDGVSGLYKLRNPNGFYVLNNQTSVITDGNVCKFEEENTYLVQNATFSVIQRQNENQLQEVQLNYRFEDLPYVFQLLQKTVDLSKELTSYEKMLQPERVIDREQFEKLTDVPGYRYKGL